MPERKKVFGVVRLLNIALLLLLLIPWMNVLLWHGLAGAISWALMKLVIAPLGVVFLSIATVALLINLARKKDALPLLISVGLSMALAFPLLLLLNVIPLAYPISLKAASPAVTVDSPFAEPVLVGWGGDRVTENMPHAIWAAERWAYDLVKEPANTGSYRLEDYGIYDKEVYAPVAGVVVAAYDQEKDIPPNTEEFTSLEGNYVYIKINATQTYLLLNHFKENSIVVKTGDVVAVGDYLGRVGNSGTTSEPHLHIHHQRQNPVEMIYPIFAEGLPLYFYAENGASRMPVSGEILPGVAQ